MMIITSDDIFIPPDGEFDLMSYRLNTHVKPLIWVDAVVEPHKGSRIEYMIKTRSQFKSRSVANNVEVIIPVPPDVDSPRFKSSVGTVGAFSSNCVDADIIGAGYRAEMGNEILTAIISY
jgi:hypothetical protein